jgi:hypothetical protein
MGYSSKFKKVSRKYKTKVVLSEKRMVAEFAKKNIFSYEKAIILAYSYECPACCSNR